MGGSFAEIFAGNCTALGLPCATLDDEARSALLDSVELDPAQEVVLDLEACTVRSRAGTAPLTIARGPRQQLTRRDCRASARTRCLPWAAALPDDEGADANDELVPFGELDAWRVLREAHDLYRQGADAVDVWEMGSAPVRLARWDVLRRIGDRPWLEQQFGSRVGGLLGEPARPLRFSRRGSD